MSSQIQNPLVDFTLNKLHGNWFYPNLVLMFTPLFSIGYIILTYKHHKKMVTKSEAQKEANNEDNEEAVNLISSNESVTEQSGDENEDTN